MATFAGIRTSSGKIVQPIGDEMIKQFQFSHATTGLNAGVVAYTPNPGDILLDAWVEIDTAFNGTTPMIDLGDMSTDGHHGWFYGANQPIDGTVADAADASNAGLLVGGGAQCGGLVAAAASNESIANQRWAPGKILSGLPIKVVVSQDGSAGGAASGSTAGSATAYFLVGTPQ